MNGLAITVSTPSPAQSGSIAWFGMLFLCFLIAKAACDK